jgi:hypothetical protein
MVTRLSLSSTSACSCWKQLSLKRPL